MPSDYEFEGIKLGLSLGLSGSLPYPFYFLAAAKKYFTARQKVFQQPLKVLPPPAENQIYNLATSGHSYILTLNKVSHTV